MEIILIQTNPNENEQENKKNILEQLSLAAEKKAQLIVLPEVCTFMGSNQKRLAHKQEINSGFFYELKKFSAEHGITLVAGSIDESCPQNKNKLFNTSVTFQNGNIINIYRKLHLFNLMDENKAPLYCESSIYEFGEKPNVYNIVIDNENWNALTIICYDIRFPEIIRQPNNPPDIIFVPAAFTWQTGKAHWETLLKARAIENQCFIVACNQTGFHSHGQKRNFGHSMIINPWGEIIAQLEEEIGMLQSHISKKALQESRSKLPALHDRKIF